MRVSFLILCERGMNCERRMNELHLHADSCTFGTIGIVWMSREALLFIGLTRGADTDHIRAVKLSAHNVQEAATSKPGGHELQVRKGSSTHRVPRYSSGPSPR